MTPLTAPGDGSATPAWNCPECDSDLANCQGVLACTDCEWIERD